jgi:hypothetical protein
MRKDEKTITRNDGKEKRQKVGKVKTLEIRLCFLRCLAASIGQASLHLCTQASSGRQPTIHSIQFSMGDLCPSTIQEQNAQIGSCELEFLLVLLIAFSGLSMDWPAGGMGGI